MADRYDRQEGLLSVPYGVAVVGCGGIGSWVAYFLALVGVPALHLFDEDRIDETNLHRLALADAMDVGECKSGMLAHKLNCQPGWIQRVVVSHSNLRSEALLDSHREALHECQWLVCSTDSLRSRRDCAQLAYEFDLKYVEAGAEGMEASVAGRPAEWASSLEDEPSYQRVPVWVGPCVLAAAKVCYHVLTGTPVKTLTRFLWKDGDMELLRRTDE